MNEGSMNARNLETAERMNGRRNGHSSVDRRTSRRRSQVRHGRIYEGSPDTARHAVPLDSADPAGLDITALPSPSSLHPQGQIRFQTQDPTTSVSNTDEESTIESRRGKAKRKLKHRDINAPDTSPNSFFEKTRKRLNSITTTSSLSPRHDDNAVSIGYPSVVQASVFPDLQEMKHQLPNTPRRTFSSDTAATISTTSVKSPLMFESDANKILQLMKTTCGRMHGILFYRPSGTTAWHSGYCAINVAPGSLICQTKGDVTKTEVLIPDLRGCAVRTQYDAQAQSTHLSVVLPVSGFGYQLRPPVPETFESWLAALLCWQPLRPRGIHNKMAKPQSVFMNDRQPIGSRRLSDLSSPRSTTIVKTGQMYLWDGSLPAGSRRHQAKRSTFSLLEHSTSWKRVNCTLHENSTLRLLSEENATPIRSLELNSLARCAIQRLDESVLDTPHCIAIHPQYTVNSPKSSEISPLVLSLQSRVAFEAWFVLLRAMTVPELYGPEIDSTTSSIPASELTSQSRNMFRIERVLSIKIIEAKFVQEMGVSDQHLRHSARSSPSAGDGMDIYADVLLGRDLCARTIAKKFANSIFWVEDFRLEDIPTVLSRVSIVLKLGNPDEKEWTMIPKGGYDLPTSEQAPDLETVEVAAHDPVYGRVDIPFSDLEQTKVIEKWWPLADGNGFIVGQALVKLSLEENVVLMESEYAQFSALLHNFHNSLTSQLGQILGSELKQLSDVLLDIFQCSNTVGEWINNLVEEEIDGIYREELPVRMRFSSRIQSNDSYESTEKRELLVRDLSRSATMEANLLFRGNSLVTKALDAHMRRIGRDYLERTLGEKVRSIVAADPDCEVDPNKVKSSERLEKNWSRLIGLTSSIWQAIATSVSRCPPGMRNILKHVRSCAEDRYGNFIRTVKYTSVSGFLFLRFFCPAILNPKMFGLLEDHPPERARRSFTLIAKSLIVLANLSKFGQKEPWMEPMNQFLTAATPEFKNFIEQFCSWSGVQGPHHEPQYQAAMQVKLRLPPLSTEGLPSLPFLLDSPRSLATLIDIWTKHAPAKMVDNGVDECVRTFHNMCLALRQRSSECMANAEQAQEPNSKLERQWQKMLSEQHKTRIALNPLEEMTSDKDITALPWSPDAEEQYSRRHYHRSGHGAENNSPPIGEDRREEECQPRPLNRSITTSTNSSNLSFEVHDEHRSRQGVRSRDGSGKSRFLEISDQRRGRNEQTAGEDVLERI